MTTSLGQQLLATPTGVAFLVAGEASDRLDEALASLGVTLCLAAHAIGEVRRGTDGGRLAALQANPPAWLLAAADRVDAAAATGALDWWSRGAAGAVHRQLGDGLTGVELVDEQGRARSLPEEAGAHLHTFLDSDTARRIRRWRSEPTLDVVEIDGPQDWAAIDGRISDDVAGHHLTLRGALTVPHGQDWPWETPGTIWHEPVEGTPLPHDDDLRWHHDHDWVAIGRSFDPRFDEGDEIDGSELSG